MKKTIYIALLSAVTIFCIVFGTWINVSGYMKSIGNLFHFNNNGKSKVEINSNEKNTFANQGKTTLTPFTSISTDLNIAELRIEKGNDYSISYDSSTSWLVPSFEVSGNTLAVSHKSKKNVKLPGNNSCKVVITVPADCHLSTCDLTVDVGELRVNNCNIDEISAEVDVGDLRLSGTKFNKGDFEVDVGEIRISDFIRESEANTYSYDLKSSIGDVSLFKNSHHSYKSTGTDAGKRIKAEVDIGEINIK